jgi:hemerythrin-like domain-containing protein
LPGDEVRGFIALYERHIAREEAELLPMAARLLSDAELDRIGLAMRARRGAIEANEPSPPSTA